MVIPTNTYSNVSAHNRGVGEAENTEIGSGMDAVIELKSTADAGKSAIKKPRPTVLGGTDPDYIDRCTCLNNEADILSLTRGCQQIVTMKVYDREMHSLELEYADGGNLDAYLTAHPRGLAVDTQSTLINDLYLGIQQLHEKNICWGDCKGGNVLIFKNCDASGAEHPRLKCADFGNSKLFEPIEDNSEANSRPNLEKQDCYDAARLMIRIKYNLNGDSIETMKERIDTEARALEIHKLLDKLNPYSAEEPTSEEMVTPLQTLESLKDLLCTL